MSQRTLALGALPIAYAAGNGAAAMPLAANEQVQLAFTIALTLFAVAALATLRPERVDAWLVAGLLAVEFIYPTTFVHVAGTLVLLVFALDLLVARRRAVAAVIRAAIAPGRRPPV